MSYQPGEFHWTNGWYFRREPDGAVRVEHRDNDDKVLSTITVPSLEWVSIIAHLGSAPGGEPANYGKALELHLVKLDIAPGAVPDVENL